MRRGWLLVGTPIGIALVVAALITTGQLPDPIVYFKANLLTFIAILSTLFTALTTTLLRLQRRAERLRQAGIAEARAAAADDRRRFLRRLDHELKNPLTAIHAAVANLAETPTALQRQTLQSITAQTVRLSRLAADLRKLADLETRPLEHAPVDMADLLAEIVRSAEERPEVIDRRLTLTLPRAPWPLSPVDGDHDLLFLALYNLVDNALKFTKPGDTVEVRAFEDGASVVVEVADTGPGILAADVDFVWEELYRGQAARGVPGSGLGLALARAIVLRHGGQVSLRTRVDQGTVVTVRLPST